MNKYGLFKAAFMGTAILAMISFVAGWTYFCLVYIGDFKGLCALWAPFLVLAFLAHAKKFSKEYERKVKNNDRSRKVRTKRKA